MSIFSRFKDAWNAFLNRDPPPYQDIGPSYTSIPTHQRLSCGSEKTIISAFFSRIAVDCASIDVCHVRLDTNKRYVETLNSGLNRCLNFSANTDQTGRDLIEDIVMSMCDEGVVAVCKTDWNDGSEDNDTMEYPYPDVLSMRTGRIVQWYPEHVMVEIFNEATGVKQNVLVAKKDAAIIPNPYYELMNEPNSTFQRLKRKLSLLDAIEEQVGSGKLDLIIQLPYTIKSDSKKEEAKRRREEIQEQLAGSRYGIAYTDGTERITQLNRPLENNILGTIQFLTNMLYSQLGFDQSILDGSADEKKMLNYTNRFPKVFMNAIVEEMRRKFLSEEAIKNGESIEYFLNPFRLVPVSSIASMADSFTRNEIMTSNEIRQILGMKPSKDPEADKLRNKNLSQPANQQVSVPSPEQETVDELVNQ